jgi:hypothetical protein
VILPNPEPQPPFHATQPFTSDFSLRDLEMRWRAMLYDPLVSMEVAVELAALQVRVVASCAPLAGSACKL